MASTSRGMLEVARGMGVAVAEGKVSGVAASVFVAVDVTGGCVVRMGDAVEDGTTIGISVSLACVDGDGAAAGFRLCGVRPVSRATGDALSEGGMVSGRDVSLASGIGGRVGVEISRPGVQLAVGAEIVLARSNTPGWQPSPASKRNKARKSIARGRQRIMDTTLLGTKNKVEPCLQVYQATAQSPDHSVSAIVGLQLGHDGTDVVLDRALGQR